MLMDFMLMSPCEAAPGTGGVFEQWAAGCRGEGLDPSWGKNLKVS